VFDWSDIIAMGYWVLSIPLDHFLRGSLQLIGCHYGSGGYFFWGGGQDLFEGVVYSIQLYNNIII